MPSERTGPRSSERASLAQAASSRVTTWWRRALPISARSGHPMAVTRVGLEERRAPTYVVVPTVGTVVGAAGVTDRVRKRSRAMVA